MGYFQITPVDQTILIITSIISFFIPGLCLLYQQHNVHGTCILLSGICSICYWYNPNSTLFHTMDVIVSRISTTFYIGSTFYYSYQVSFEHVLSTFIITIQVVYNYMRSRNMFEKQDPIWILYHVMFHLSCLLSILFSYGLLAYYLEPKKLNSP
jgi:hypothetical protein